MKSIVKLISAFALCCFAAAAAAEAYPTKPIRIVIPFPPGGAVDTLIRTITPELTAELGQPIIVDNRPGGGAQIGASVMMSAPPDGYTLFAGEVGAFAINPTLYKKFSYNPVRDFEAVASLVRTPMVMFSNASGRLNSVEAFKNALTSGDIAYASFGPGTAPHILGHLLSKGNPKVNFTHVPYKGYPPAILGLLAKDVDLLFDGVPGVLNQTKSGKVTALAVAAPQRSPLLPNVPTTAELGQPKMVMDLWVGVVARKGTPDTIIQRLHAAFEKAMSSPAVWKKFSEFGYNRLSMTPEEFNRFIRAEIDKYRPIIVDSGAVVD
jgi:tripartite-type tricarboxylate transporter receptor subunit TctC